MIERLKETGGWAFGFKVTGKVTEEDVKAFEPQLEFAIAERKKRPLGILADVSEMDSVDLAARWEELRFLHKYSDHIARVALVGASKWEDVVSTFVGGTVLFHGRDPLLPSGRDPAGLALGEDRQTCQRRSGQADLPGRNLEGLPGRVQPVASFQPSAVSYQ